MIMGHPKGVYAISLIEMWERFSFFLVAGVLVLYMIEVLHFSVPFSNFLYGIIVGACYILQLVTGMITDSRIGNRKAITIGSILMLIGQVIFAYDAHLYYLNANVATHGTFIFNYPEIVFFIGVVFLSVGTSFLKVSATSFVSLFYEEQDTRLDAAYTLFYMVMNFGTFFAPLLLGIVVGVHNPELYQYGFMIGAVINFIGLINFIYVKDRYLCSESGEALGVAPIQEGEEIKEVIEEKKKSRLTNIELDRVKASIIVLVVAIVFFIALEQITTSMVILVMNYVDTTLPLTGYNLSPQMFISLNPLFVIIMSPLFIKFLSWLAVRNKEPSSIGKMSLGLITITISYLILLLGVYLSPGKMNMLWIVLFNFTLVISELFIAPIGLSLVSKLAPVKYLSLMVGTFFAATAVSEVLAGIFASAFPEKAGVANSLFGIIPIPDLASFVWVFIILSGVVFVFWVLSTNRIKALMHGIE